MVSWQVLSTRGSCHRHHFLSPFLNLCFEICMSICWKKRSTRNKIWFKKSIFESYIVEGSTYHSQRKASKMDYPILRGSLKLNQRLPLVYFLTLCADPKLSHRPWIPDKDFCTWESIKTSVYHIGVKIVSVLLVMPPTQLRRRLAKGQIKQCRMDILLENFYLSTWIRPMHFDSCMNSDMNLPMQW